MLLNLNIPEFALVLLIGPSGSGKTTFAHKHFIQTQIVSSDHSRALISDDENNQTVTKDAFEILHLIVEKRLLIGKLTVIDATNVQSSSRKPLIALAKRYHCPVVAILFDLPEEICCQHNAARVHRQVDTKVIHQQSVYLRQSLPNLEAEGFHTIYKLKTLEEIKQTVIEKQTLPSNKKDEHGPFDIIGDVHGCFDELYELMINLGYKIEFTENEYHVQPPKGRKIIFVGDLVDRGPKTPQVLKLVMSMIESGVAFCVAGNHDAKLWKKLSGRDVKIAHGLAESLEQLGKESLQFNEKVKKFLFSLSFHYVFDNGKLVIAHAGLKEYMHGRLSDRIRSFALYGETSGEVDGFGLPIRYNWAAKYHGKALVVYGHVPVPEAEWINNTICIDTGCVFGGSLTALRYPEKELVSIKAHHTYFEPTKPLLPITGMPVKN